MIKGHIKKLILKVATTLPIDVKHSLETAYKKEKLQNAKKVLEDIQSNIALAEKNKIPLCQDTGVPTFYVKVPKHFSHKTIIQDIIDATREATKEIPLRPNAVDSLEGTNTGDNIGFNDKRTEVQQPIIYIDQWDKNYITIDLMLKGGGSENIGALYKLPDKNLKADRNIEGVKKCVIDAVFQAQGKGCPPYVIGVAIGGSKDMAAKESKKQLLRNIYDTNRDKKLAKLENELREKINSLGIGPLGLGGKTTVLAVKIKALHRHPASFFVDISFMCWACRRGKLIYRNGDAIFS